MERDATAELQRQLGWRPPTATLELSLGLAKLKVELGEFVALVRGLLGAVKHDEVRAALREMMAEVRRTYDTIVDVLTPLHELDSEEKFKTRFGPIRATYKKSYLKSSGLVRTRCGIIADKMALMLGRRGWLRGVPLARRSYKRLKSLCANWLLIDLELAREMDDFLGTLNKILDAVSRERKVSESAAFEHLHDVLAQMEDDLRQVKTSLDELDRLSSAI